MGLEDEINSKKTKNKKKRKASFKALHCKGKRSPRANHGKNNKSSTSINNNNSGGNNNKKLVTEIQRDIEMIDGLDSGISKYENGVDQISPINRNDGRWQTVGGENFRKRNPLAENDTVTFQNDINIIENCEEIVDNFLSKDGYAISQLSCGHDGRRDIILNDNTYNSSKEEEKCDEMISIKEQKKDFKLSEEKYGDDEERSSLKSNCKESKKQTEYTKKNFMGSSTSNSSNIYKLKDANINHFKHKENNDKLKL